jgi:hypothetical protein
MRSALTTFGVKSQLLTAMAMMILDCDTVYLGTFRKNMLPRYCLLP